MSKYIIELDENAKEVVVISIEDGDMWTGTMEVEDLEQLNSDYINEHFGDLQDTAYQKGYDAGIIASSFVDKSDEAYQRGFEDGKWKSEDGCTGCKYEGKTGEHLPCDYCMNNFKNQWTAKDDEIEVGDEVEVLNSGNKYLIAWFAGTSLCGFAHDGVTCRLQPSDVRKTGRHFDIDKILEEMRT